MRGYLKVVNVHVEAASSVVAYWRHESLVGFTQDARWWVDIALPIRFFVAACIMSNDGAIARPLDIILWERF